MLRRGEGLLSGWVSIRVPAPGHSPTQAHLSVRDTSHVSLGESDASRGQGGCAVPRSFSLIGVTFPGCDLRLIRKASFSTEAAKPGCSRADVR